MDVSLSLEERRSLASQIIRHLTNPEDSCYTLPAKYLGTCLRAIHLATIDLHADVHTPCGLIRTAGQIIEMFRLHRFVDWDQAKAKADALDRNITAIAKKERRRDGYAEVQHRISFRIQPKGITGCW